MESFLSLQWQLGHVYCLTRRDRQNDDTNNNDYVDGYNDGGGSGSDNSSDSSASRSSRGGKSKEKENGAVPQQGGLARYLHIGRTTEQKDAHAAAVFAEKHPDWLVVIL